MPAPELVGHIAKAIEETIECGSPNAVAFVAAIAYETWLAEQGLEIKRKKAVRQNDFSDDCDICGDPATSFSSDGRLKHSLCFAHSQAAQP